MEMSGQVLSVRLLPLNPSQFCFVCLDASHFKAFCKSRSAAAVDLLAGVWELTVIHLGLSKSVSYLHKNTSEIPRTSSRHKDITSSMIVVRVLALKGR